MNVKYVFAAICAAAFNLYAGIETYFTMENDTLIARRDHDYTHGTGFKVANRPWHYKIGQNIYTPSDLRREDHIKGDRPYSGILYGGIGRELWTDSRSPWTHYAELDFGMIGPHSYAEESQKIIHMLLDCRYPKGWHNQLHDEFVVNGQWWTKYNFYVWKRYAAIVPRAGALAGTVQDAAEIGIDFKIGWNMENDTGNQIMFSASGKRSWLDDLSVWAFIGCDERYYLYNHFLEGSLFSDRDKDLKVDIEPFVFEWRFGAALRYRSFFVYYYGVFREDEFKHQKDSPKYGGLCLGWIW